MPSAVHISVDDEIDIAGLIDVQDLDAVLPICLPKVCTVRISEGEDRRNRLPLRDTSVKPAGIHERKSRPSLALDQVRITGNAETDLVFTQTSIVLRHIDLIHRAVKVKQIDAVGSLTHAVIFRAFVVLVRSRVAACEDIVHPEHAVCSGDIADFRHRRQNFTDRKVSVHGENRGAVNRHMGIVIVVKGLVCLQTLIENVPFLCNRIVVELLYENKLFVNNRPVVRSRFSNAGIIADRIIRRRRDEEDEHIFCSVFDQILQLQRGFDVSVAVPVPVRFIYGIVFDEPAAVQCAYFKRQAGNIRSAALHCEAYRPVFVNRCYAGSVMADVPGRSIAVQLVHPGRTLLHDDYGECRLVHVRCDIRALMIHERLEKKDCKNEHCRSVHQPENGITHTVLLLSLLPLLSLPPFPCNDARPRASCP